MVTWFKENSINSVAMESTGVYWIPIYDILAESGFEVLLVNAHHLKSVPGRKTDVKDCQWIQRLHSYGLLRGSFRPNNHCVTLRSYVRQRSKLFELASIQGQLMHKALTQMNLQLNLVISDITGATGMQIIRAIIAGDRNPLVLAEMKDYRCKKDKETIAKALEGNYRPELIFALEQSLQAYDFFHSQIVTCEEKIEKILQAWSVVIKGSQVEKNINGDKKDTLGKNGKGLQKKTTYNKSPYHFDVVTELNKILGVNLSEIPGFDANIIVKIIGEISNYASTVFHRGKTTLKKILLLFYRQKLSRTKKILC